MASDAPASREIQPSGHLAPTVEQTELLAEESVLQKSDVDPAAMAEMDRQIQDLLTSFYGRNSSAPAATAAASRRKIRT
jgi:hypothetical protein